MVTISVALAIGLMALGVLAMLISGIKGLSQGKQDIKRIGIMSVPFVVFGISFLALDDVSKAGVMTAGVLMAGMVLSIALTGLRGTFKF